MRSPQGGGGGVSWLRVAHAAAPGPLHLYTSCHFHTMQIANGCPAVEDNRPPIPAAVGLRPSRKSNNA